MSENVNQEKEKRVKLYRRQLAAHKPKNRSSKHLRCLTGVKPIWRCMSGEQLKNLSRNGCFEASIELDRRARGYEKRETRKQRCGEKLSAERAAKV